MMTPLYPEHGDKLENYQTITIQPPGMEPMIVLDRYLNGDCVYLGPAGCTIYGKAPYVCRQFDCRKTFLNSTRPGRKKAIKEGSMTKEIFDRGRELVGTLK
jgi:Fe-S-cluster containining protein